MNFTNFVPPLLFVLAFSTAFIGRMAGVIGLGFLAILSLLLLLKSREARLSVTSQIRRTRKAPLFLLALGFLAAWLLSSSLGINPSRSLSTWVGPAVLSLLALVVHFGFVACRDKVQAWLHYFPTVLTAVCLLGAACYLLSYSEIWPYFNVVRFGEEDGSRPQYRLYSSIVAMSLPFLWHAWIKNPTFLRGFTVFSSTCALVLAFGRSGWLAAIVAVPFFIILYPWKELVQKRMNVFSCGLISISAVLTSFYVMTLTVESSELARRTVISASQGSGSTRIRIWEFALDKFVDNPWLGIGLKGFRSLDLSNVTFPKFHPHNMFIEILLGTGVIGATAFVAFVACVLIPIFGRTWSYRNVAPNEVAFQAAAISSLAAYGVSAMLLTSFFHVWWGVYFVLLLTLVVSFDRTMFRK